MACGAVPHDPLTGPVCVPLPVSPTNPVALLPEVALSAELVAVVEIYFPVLLVREQVQIFFIVAGFTFRSFFSLPVDKLYLSVSQGRTFALK